MQSTQTRRRLLATLSSAMAAGLIGDVRVSAQEAPPETTVIMENFPSMQAGTGEEIGSFSTLK